MVLVCDLEMEKKKESQYLKPGEKKQLAQSHNTFRLCWQFGVPQ